MRFLVTAPDGEPLSNSPKAIERKFASLMQTSSTEERGGLEGGGSDLPPGDGAAYESGEGEGADADDNEEDVQQQQVGSAADEEGKAAAASTSEGGSATAAVPDVWPKEKNKEEMAIEQLEENEELGEAEDSECEACKGKHRAHACDPAKRAAAMGTSKKPKKPTALPRPSDPTREQRSSRRVSVPTRVYVAGAADPPRVLYEKARAQGILPPKKDGPRADQPVEMPRQPKGGEAAREGSEAAAARRQELKPEKARALATAAEPNGDQSAAATACLPKEKTSTKAKEQHLVENEENAELGVWVQCDACDKWRQLLPGVPEPEDGEPWFCHNNADTACNSCDAPEAVADGSFWMYNDECDLGGTSAAPRVKRNNAVNDPAGLSRLRAHFEENGVDVALLEGWSCLKHKRGAHGGTVGGAFYYTFHGRSGEKARSHTEAVRVVTMRPTAERAAERVSARLSEREPAEAEAEGGDEDEEEESVGAPRAESGRWHVLRALLADHADREDLVAFVEEQSDFGVNTKNGPRHMIFKVLRGEANARQPLWTQDGTAYTLTAAGKSLRGTAGFEDEEDDEEDEEAAGLPSGGRYYILRALVAGHRERDDVVSHVMACSSIGAGTTSGARGAIVTILGREKQQQEPLWTQADAEYTLTEAGEALRASVPAEEAAPKAAGGGSTSSASAVVAVAPPLVAEEVIDANDSYTRFQVRWVGKPISAATWEPARKVDAALIAAFIGLRQIEFNRSIEPLLAHAGASGVVSVLVPEAAAAACAAHLHERWADGRLPLAGGKECRGYSSYGKVLSTHDAALQAATTLLITNPLLPAVRLEVPGFFEIEEYLIGWLHETFGTVVELFYAHGLRQGPLTLKSTGFDVHQDTEDYDFIEYTVVVKLTSDEAGAPPSQMRVVGATNHFSYASPAGASAAFRARVHHASVAPEDGAGEHLKIAYFFRASQKGERRAKRALAAEGGTDEGEALAQRRRRVADELNAYSLEAQALQSGRRA